MEKLSQFNQNLKIKIADQNKASAQLDGINQNLDQMLALSQQAIKNLNRFFDRYEISENYLSVGGLDEIATLRLNKHIQAQGNKPGKDPVDLLPFHIGDRDWLVQYAAEFMQKNHPQANLTLAQVREFVETSPAFQQALADYEQRLIVAQIQHTRVTEPTEEDRQRYNQNHELYRYEEVFRDQIIFGMNLLGVDRHTTEATLETHADLWRTQHMLRTFNEFFYPETDRPADKRTALRWNQLRNSHADKWLQYNEYLYYQKHQAILDETQAVTKNMKMVKSQAGEVLQEVCEYDDLRRNLVRAATRQLANQTTAGRIL